MKLRPFKFIGPNGHWNPFEYKKGNPQPRQRIICTALISHDPEVARELAELIRNDPTIDMKVLEKWARLRNAEAHSRSIERLREVLVERRDFLNGLLESQIKDLKVELKSLKTRATSLAPDYEALRLKTGGDVKDGVVYYPTDIGRYSDDAVAGKHDLHTGRNKKPWFSEAIGWATSIGSGAILGTSMGLLSGKLNLAAFDPVAGLIFIGGGMLAFVAASKSLRPKSFKLGEFSFTGHFTSKVGKWLVPGVFFVSLLVLVVLIGMSDMNVETYGIFKGISESATRAGLKLTPEVIRWAALVITVPVIGYAFAPSFADGYETASRKKLKSIQEETIGAMTASEEGDQFARVAAVYGPLKDDIKTIEAKISALEAAITNDLTEEERLQIQEMTDDSIDYNTQAIGAAGFPEYYETGKSSQAKSKSDRPWWRSIRSGR